jgi:hypothetical protein
VQIKGGWKYEKKVNRASRDLRIPFKRGDASQNYNGKEQGDGGNKKRGKKNITAKVGSKSNGPGIKWIEPGFEFVRRAVAKLG